MSSLIDLTGQRFGRWTVLERDTAIHKKNIYWKCRCDCGTERSVAGTSLRSGLSVSCGCEKDELSSKRTSSRVDDMTGQRFGMWTVLRRDTSKNEKAKRGARWICRCDCGTEKSVLGYSLRMGRTTNCGCNQDNKMIDLSNQRFGKLTVITRDKEPRLKGKGAWWICKCDCGNTISVPCGYLRSGQTRSCGCDKSQNISLPVTGLEGKRFGSWTVLQRDHSKKGQGVFYICQCDCGTVRSIQGTTLINGRSRSCGCGKSVPKEDLTGQRFGQLTVIGRDESKNAPGVFWLCKCDCGKINSYRTNILKKGRVKSCGCMIRRISFERKFIDITGQRFGRLVAVSVDHKDCDSLGNTSYYWLCRCDCGNEIVVQGSVLRRGDTASCGCLRADESAKRARDRLTDLTGRRFGLLTVIERVELSDSGIGKWKCRCDCGNIKLADGYHLKRGMITSCGCLKQSKLELFVLQYFDEKGYTNTVDYEYQKRFHGLRGYGGGLLSYDFAFYVDQKLKFLIECQGQQHFEPIGIFGGEDQFAKQQIHDEAKKNYALSLGVPLIEIPYTAESYDDVKNLLCDYGL